MAVEARCHESYSENFVLVQQLIQIKKSETDKKNKSNKMEYIWTFTFLSLWPTFIFETGGSAGRSSKSTKREPAWFCVGGNGADVTMRSFGWRKSQSTRKWEGALSGGYGWRDCQKWRWNLVNFMVISNYAMMRISSDQSECRAVPLQPVPQNTSM